MHPQRQAATVAVLPGRTTLLLMYPAKRRMSKAEHRMTAFSPEEDSWGAGRDSLLECGARMLPSVSQRKARSHGE